VKGYGLDGGAIGVRFPAGTTDFLLSTASRQALGDTQALIEYVPGTVSRGKKLSGCEADNSLPSGANVKNGGAIPPLPIRFHGVDIN
jgi:hypothetical protein